MEWSGTLMASKSKVGSGMAVRSSSRGGGILFNDIGFGGGIVCSGGNCENIGGGGRVVVVMMGGATVAALTIGCVNAIGGRLRKFGGALLKATGGSWLGVIGGG